MRFSSKLPPRTLYWELSSFVEDTPGRVLTRSSTPPAELLGISDISRASSRVMVAELICRSEMTTSDKVVEIDLRQTSTLRCSPDFNLIFLVSC